MSNRMIQHATRSFIFIGEIASGWVKNIRSIVREDKKRVICKTEEIGVRKDDIILGTRANQSQKNAEETDFKNGKMNKGHKTT